MKILITSGGTKIPIDKVRSITNMSNGTFGSQIADSFNCSKEDYLDIRFLMAKKSKFPKLQTRMIPYFYETFWEYKDQLDKQLEEKPDIIILAAAVSDYEVENYINGKIRSKDELTIKLKPLPKLISTVREKCPNSLICGFKLLVNSTKEELLTAAYNSIIKNKVDLVIANDLSTIKDTKDHSMWVVESDKKTQYFRRDYNLPNIVRDKCIRIWKEKYNNV